MRKRRLQTWRSGNRSILLKRIGNKFKILCLPTILLRIDKCWSVTCSITINYIESIKNIKSRKVYFIPRFSRLTGVSLCIMTTISKKRKGSILTFKPSEKIIHLKLIRIRRGSKVLIRVLLLAISLCLKLIMMAIKKCSSWGKESEGEIFEAHHLHGKDLIQVLSMKRRFVTVVLFIMRARSQPTTTWKKGWHPDPVHPIVRKELLSVE